jgi:hypothetical protein
MSSRPGRATSRDVLRPHVRQVGNCLVVSFGWSAHKEKALARSLPAEEGRVAVVVGHLGPEVIPELAEELQRWVPFGWESVRLVAARAATANEDATPPAQELAEMLSVEVIAPDGRLLSVPGGALFVLRGRGQETLGSWWRFRPGRAPEMTGRRFPTPAWERELGTFTDPGIPDAVVEELPCGLWLHRPGEPRPGDLAYALPINPAGMTVVVSHACDPPVPSSAVQRLIQALPEGLHDHLVLVPYGDEPVSGARLGTVASLAANQTLQVRNGMPLSIKGRGTQVVAVGQDGVPTWRPFVRDLAWRPHGGSRILNWVPPADNLLPAGEGQLLVTPRWLVEVTEAGLWVREHDRVDGASLVRQLPLRSKYCTVVVGVEGDNPSHPPWRAIVAMLRRLPADARRRLRLVLPYTSDDRIAQVARRSCHRLLRGRPLYVLTAAGRLEQWTSAAGRTAVGAARSTRFGPSGSDPDWWTEPEDWEGESRKPRTGSTLRGSRKPGATAERAKTSGPDGRRDDQRAGSGRRPVDLPPPVAVPDHVINEEADASTRSAESNGDARSDGETDQASPESSGG